MNANAAENETADAPRTNLLIETTWKDVPNGAIVTVPAVGGTPDSDALATSSDAGMAFFVEQSGTRKIGVPLRNYRTGNRPAGSSDIEQTFDPEQRLVIREVVSVDEIESSRQERLEYKDPHGGGHTAEQINSAFDQWRNEIDQVLQPKEQTA